MKKSIYITILTLLIGFTAFATNGLRLAQNYPNPAKGKTYIEVDFDSPSASFKVYNILGKMVMQQEITEPGTFVLDVSEYAEGVYIYTLESDGAKISKRLTVKK